MKFKKAGLLTKLVLAALLLYAAVSLVSVRGRTAALEAEAERLRTEAAEMTQSNSSLQYRIDHRDDAQTIEEIAREKLKLVRPGEKIFYDISN